LCTVALAAIPYLLKNPPTRACFSRPLIPPALGLLSSFFLPLFRQFIILYRFLQRAPTCSVISFPSISVSEWFYFFLSGISFPQFPECPVFPLSTIILTSFFSESVKPFAEFMETSDSILLSESPHRPLQGLPPFRFTSGLLRASFCIPLASSNCLQSSPPTVLQKGVSLVDENLNL